MRVELRPVTLPDDAEFLESLYASRREDLKALPMDPAHIAALIRMQYEAQTLGHEADSPMASHYIIEVNGAAAGRYIIDTSAPAEDHAVDIALLPEFRGRGVGTSVLSGSIDAAHRMGKGLSLYVEPGNPALRLYLRLGGKIAKSDPTRLLIIWPAQKGEEQYRDD